MYEYRATILRVVDGDTVDVTLDLGFDVHLKQRLRLRGIDAPELRTTEGKASRDWLRTLLPPGESVVVRTEKDRREKYGRYLATVQAAPQGWGGLVIDVCTELLKAGHASPYTPGA